MQQPLPTTLISIVGLTPQVVTETLYCLAVQREIPVKEILIITTPEGRKRILGEEELPPLQQQIAALAKRYHITLPHFDPLSSIYVGNEPIEDPNFWRTEPDLPAFPDLLIQLLKQRTQDFDSRIHLSLAGGRKTMSALATLLFSLWARPQDELSHVLASEEFLRSGKFFPHTNAEAQQVVLVNLPMPKLQLLLNIDKINRFQSYRELLEYLTTEFEIDIAPPQVILDYPNRSLCIVGYGNSEIKFQPFQFAVYALLFESRQPLRFGVDTIEQHKTQLLQLYQAVSSQRRYQKFLQSLNKAAMPNAELVERIQKQFSEINRLLQRHLSSEKLVELLKISTTGSYGNTQHFIKLPYIRRKPIGRPVW